ncbi:PREDICTED: uncharacterized protein LOC109462690 [Branchiostoma belcheri]|uniref:receptor protein-tyrosine kinase n=1 Tax=Branchiostoma belcheri TaxID=7741 RepID=A0A6P4XE24_BRABE|nr:PREDICTED: uncharacterized protein LOC109462690 [Branchiostoma belcheri]
MSYYTAIVSSFRPCENGGTLTSGPEDSGLYICACPAGWHGAFCGQKSPGDVTVNVTAVNSTALHVRWTVGVSGNLNIIDSQVRYKQSDAGDWGAWSSTRVSDEYGDVYIRGLRPAVMYDVQVRVNNSLGWSDPGNGTGTTDEAHPTAPVVQTFADQHDCNCRTPNLPRPVQLRVAWRRPDHIHGQLQAYRISLYNRTGGEPFYQENMTSGLQQENLTAVITSPYLQPARNYSVTVSAINTFYHGNESYPYMTRTNEGCPNAPTVTRMANNECGVTWTAPSITRGRLAGYNVTYTYTPRVNPDESDLGISYDTFGSDQQQWSKSLDELPSNSLVRVTVRALTCAEGDKGAVFTCEVPPRVVFPTYTDPPLKASPTSFPMVLPKVSERNGPIRCCQVIVIKMTKSESLFDLETRVGEPDVILTDDAPDEGKTEPYVALSLSGELYRKTDVVEIGDGGPCGHEWCCGRSELADASLAKEPGNKELQPGEKYTAAVRCYVDPSARRRKRNTEVLFTTSGYIEPVITGTVNQPEGEPVPVAAIVGGSVSALLVVILVTVGIVCYRKRKSKDDRDPTGPQIDLKIITEDETPIKESAENPTALVEDTSPYETTIYSIADLVTVDDVVEFLKAKGFGKYAAAFRRHEVDGEGAMSLTSDMLAELVPEIGPRAKLQKALQELKDNQHQESTESSKPVHPDWEIPRSSLKLGKILGKGQFGEVRMGELRKRGVTETVAVKTLKASAEERDKEDLIGELDILVTVGRHDNIISLVGACTVGGPLTLVVEYAANGCLKDWLRNNRPKELNKTDDKDIATSGILLPMEQLITFGLDIANGMTHLAAMQCVHRDLAARNVLLGKDLTAKISDFGLSRDIYEESEYVKTTKSQLPIRWIAYESLFYHVYTTQSDVWSFGILLWEIMTMGKQPYGRMTGKELMKLLPGGYRLEKPALCPQDVYEVMKTCWETLPENRPTFPELKATLDRIIQDHRTYASLLK